MERRIVVEGREILYELTAKKVKNLNLRVRPDGRVAVSVPRRLSPEAADRFVLSRGPWLLRALGPRGRRGGMRFPKPPFPDCGANRWTSSAGRVPPRGGAGGGAPAAHSGGSGAGTRPAPPLAVGAGGGPIPRPAGGPLSLGRGRGGGVSPAPGAADDLPLGKLRGGHGWVTLNTALLFPAAGMSGLRDPSRAGPFPPPGSFPRLLRGVGPVDAGHREVRRRMRDFQPRALLLGESIVP